VDPCHTDVDLRHTDVDLRHTDVDDSCHLVVVHPELVPGCHSSYLDVELGKEDRCDTTASGQVAWEESNCSE
jgi:hypothetical protein